MLFWSLRASFLKSKDKLPSPSPGKLKQCLWEGIRGKALLWFFTPSVAWTQLSQVMQAMKLAGLPETILLH